jgi:hypothetical protein
MKISQRLGAFLGVGGDRSAQAPQYVALADGLVVARTHAEAWFVLDSSNTDLMSEVARDAEQDQATAALSKSLAGYDCHLRVLWSPLQADEYHQEAEELFSVGDYQAWAALRVERMEDLALPSRHLLLGVRITDRTPEPVGRQRAHDALGIGSTSVTRRELARLDALARRLGRRLEASPWRAQPAAVEMLAWMIAREQRRDAVMPAPSSAGVITGAKLAGLTRGRILPYPDHLRIVDTRGQTNAWAAVLTMTGFPENLDSPGSGEWLRVLSQITYVPELEDLDDVDEDDDRELDLPVSPEASVRFRVMSKREALKTVNEQRRSAKEQRRSAARHSAEDAGLDIEETEGAMAELARDITRSDTTLVEDHPRLIVSSTVSLADLQSRVDAVITHYGGMGIEVIPGDEEMRELWLETQPGDRIRIPDLGHVRDVEALAGSWWWGGAHVGDDNGPITGFLTGSTQGVFRNDVTAGSERGDATTSAYIGRSGRGKTTSMMLDMLNAGFRGSFVLALDFKGDLGGIVTAARHYGLNAHLVEAGIEFAGVCDLFALLTDEGAGRAQTEVPAQLSIAVPRHLRDRGAETPIQQATNSVISEGEPATWKVIEKLRYSSDPFAQETGEALYELAQTPTGAPFMGRPTGAAPLRPEAGIWVMRMPGLTLPTPDDAFESWNVAQRLSVALVHSLLAYGITTAGRQDLRGMRKVVAVPELHVLTATQEGASFLNYLARVGRALGTSLLLDTQDCESLARLVGVVEALTMVAGFQLTTERQQDALAEILGLPVGPHTRALIQAVGVDSDREVWHGHCIVRDRRFNCATVQWDIPSEELRQMLSTTPEVESTGGPDMTKQEAAV